MKVSIAGTKQQIGGEEKISPEVSFPVADLEGSIPERFDKIVNLYPDQMAIKFEETVHTYSEFNQMANQVAHLIKEQIRSPGEPVGYLLQNGIHALIAIFGILKAGGGYLSLDPSFPQDRLQYMVADSGARIILTRSEHLSLAGELTPKDSLVINLDNLSIGSTFENPQLKISPDTLAGLYYTSGSTGKPKGVIHNHRTLLRAGWSTVQSNEIQLNDRFALLYSTGFAASMSPIFGSLLSGAGLCLFNFRYGITRLAEWLKEEKITLYSSVPSLFRHMAMTLSEDQKFPHLRIISGGGEAFLKSDVELYKKFFSQYTIMRHVIGGTEMLGYRAFTIDKDTEIPGNVVPVGYPVQDKEALILDENGNEVGFNEVGEIVIRSEYLSPGYWRKPDLTQEKFKDDPDHPGMRLYWSGDLGRMEEDGCLYHLGRKDFQVKIRGFRVEIGEIESVLMQHEGVQEAAVIVDERPGFDKLLVAFVVSARGRPAPTSEELRIFVKENLPDYMVPFAFINLESMPRTPTGKINRLGLPTLEDIFHLEEDFVPPRDEIEKRLIKIWENVMGIGPIGIEHDFFQLGGHSILAANLITEIEESFGVRLELAKLTDAPTVRQQAELLREGVQPKSKSCLVPIQADGSKPPLYCVHGVGGHILPFLKLASYLGSDHPVIGVQSKDMDERNSENYSLEIMAGDYVKEILAYQPEGPYFLAGFSFGGFVAYEMARQFIAQGHEVGLLTILDTQAASAPRFVSSLSTKKLLAYRSKRILKKIDYHIQNISKLPPQDIPRYLKKKRDKPSAQEVIMGDVEEEEVPDYMLSIIKANVAALGEYIPGEYNGKVVLIKSQNHGLGEYYGWNELVKGEVEVHYVPGTHRGILQEPNVERVAEKLKNYIYTA